MLEKIFSILIFFISFKGVFRYLFEIERGFIFCKGTSFVLGIVTQIQFNNAVSFIFCVEGDLTEFLHYYVMPRTKWQYFSGHFFLFETWQTRTVYPSHCIGILTSSHYYYYSDIGLHCICFALSCRRHSNINLMCGWPCIVIQCG